MIKLDACPCIGGSIALLRLTEPLRLPVGELLGLGYPDTQDVLLTAKELYDFYHLEQSFKDQCTRRQQQAQAAKKQASQPAPQKK